jgi:hypothetical protein
VPNAFLARGTAILDLTGEDVDERGVDPWLLDEAARPPAHRLDGRVDCAPAGHHDHRQMGIERSRARDQFEAFASGRGVARVVEVGQQQLVWPLSQPLEGGGR